MHATKPHIAIGFPSKIPNLRRKKPNYITNNLREKRNLNNQKDH